jgi:hypothetical protein
MNYRQVISLANVFMHFYDVCMFEDFDDGSQTRAH